MKKGLQDPAFGGVQAIERALILLEQLASAGTWVGISELSQATGQPVGTVHRLLMTLNARGYVTRDERTRRYTLGPACHLLANRAQYMTDWKALATPLLRQLVEISGETANLAILDSNYAVYVAQAQSTRIVRMFAELGNRIPLHATGCGKVLLAYQPEDVITFLLEQINLTAFTSTTIIAEDLLLQELTLVRLRGYAIDNCEQEEGVRCLSVPVMGEFERIQAAISITGPSSRLEDQRMHDLIPQLQRISTDLTAMLLNP